MIILISKNTEQTQKIGEITATLSNNEDIILLKGELGVGKTAFVKGFLKGRQIKNYQGSSPSFVLQHVYEENNNSVVHYDLYKSDEKTLIETDIFCRRKSCIILIEWAQKITMAIDYSICIEIEHLTQNSRVFKLEFKNPLKHVEFAKLVSQELNPGNLRYKLVGAR